MSDESSSVLRRSVREARRSDSLLLRSYAVVAVLVGALTALLVLLAIPGWIAGTLGGSGQVTFSRALLPVIGLLLIAPLFAPVIYAARRRRADEATDRTDLAFALSGYLFVASLYVALLISAPAGSREPPPPALAPVVEPLYALDPVYGLVAPAIAALVVFLADRLV